MHTFQMGHSVAFDYAERLAAIAPGGPAAQLDRVKKLPADRTPLISLGPIIAARQAGAQ